MNSQEKSSNICPNCAAENKQIEDAWLSLMTDGDVVRCTNCNEPLHTSQVSSSDGSNQNRFFIRFLLIAAGLSGLFLLLNSHLDVLSLTKDLWNSIYIIILILFISSTLAYGKIYQKLKYLSIWVGIFSLLIVGYSYRHDLTGIKNKVLAELVPAKGVQSTLDSISFPVSSDGHFYIRAFINEIPIIFLVDTGASDIVFSPSDAKKLGFEISELKFNRIYETANGTVRGSSFRIDDLKIGAIHIKDMGASINEANMRNSLLGMTFFKQLKSYEVKNDVLTLYWLESIR